MAWPNQAAQQQWGGVQANWGAPPQNAWGSSTGAQQYGQWGAQQQSAGWGMPPAAPYGAPPQPQFGAPPSAGQWGAPPSGQYGVPPPSQFGASAQQAPQGPLTWSDPIDMNVPYCDGDHFEIKKLIAREYNNSPAASGDQISSQNIEIVNVAPQGANAHVTFRVSDGTYPPDPQERGILKWLILGGIAGGVAYKINQSRRRRVMYGAP